jgi:hypothetical protein
MAAHLGFDRHPGRRAEPDFHFAWLPAKCSAALNRR